MTGEERRRIEAIAGELTLAAHDGNVAAVAIVYVNAAGDVITSYGASEGTKLALLAGTMLLQQGLVDLVRHGAGVPTTGGLG